MDVRTCSVFDFLPTTAADSAYCVSVPFVCGGALLDSAAAPLCRLTLAAAGSMRFRWNEGNPVREAFLRSMHVASAVPLELIHSKTVYAVNAAPSSGGILAESVWRDDCCRAVRPEQIVCTGDGLITRNRMLTPIITVADCMPIYLYDPVSGCFGVLHSGWKGTGIAANALRLACAVYGAKVQDFLAVLGPHIHECCYTVDAERAAYFAGAFTPECVSPVQNGNGQYRLSLAKANIALLIREGVLPQNILHCTDCTCCSNRFGSFRRQTAGLPSDIPLEERIRHFIAMAAFIQ